MRSPLRIIANRLKDKELVPFAAMKTPAFRRPSLVIRHCRAAATSFVLAAAAVAATADPAPADPAAMVGAKAVIAAALRPAPKAAAETNSYDRFLLAVRALGDRQVETHGAVAPDAWLAAVDLALAVEQDTARTIPAADGPADGNASKASVRSRLEALLSVLPGPEGWDAIRAGLRERADRLAVASAPDAEKAEKKTPDARPVLLAALRAAADFLGEGGRGAPDSLSAFSALSLPEKLTPNRVEKWLAALRRTMENPGVPARAPFSAERLLRIIERLRHSGGEYGVELRLAKELADLPDAEFAPLAASLLAPAAEGDGKSWYYGINFEYVPSNGLARLAEAAATTENAGPFAWMLLDHISGMESGPDAHPLFNALVAAQNPLATIRKRVADARAWRADLKAEHAEDGEDEEEDEDESAADPATVFSWDDHGTPIARYASALCNLVSRDLDAGRLADAEALAEPLTADDWAAVVGLVRMVYGNGLSVQHPADAWRTFLEARLPKGEALLRSRFLSPYATACLPDQRDRFEATFTRLLGDDAGSDKAKKVLREHRLAFARETGDLDALEADFLEQTDPASKDAGLDSEVRDWCRALEALGETNRLVRALDRVLAFAAAPAPDGGRRKAPAWAIPILSRIGRFGDAEAVAGAAMAEIAGKMRKDAYFSYEDAATVTELLRVYLDAGRPADALDLAAGWPRWKDSAIRATDYLAVSRDSLPATLAAALVRAGGETNRATATAIARAAIGKFGTSRDWPFEILIETMPGEAFRKLADELVRLNPYEERPWQWKAESLRREGDLAGAEAAARRAIEIDPTDGEADAGDRIRSYSILASILEEKGGAEAEKEAATLRRVVAAVRAAEKGDELADLGYTAGAIARYDEAAALFSDAYCVQWRLAERLRKAGREAEAVAHYEETFRHMPAQFGQVASLCFGCEGVFTSSESVGAAERILPSLAAAPGAGASVHYLLGMLRDHQKRYNEAYSAYASALEIDPGHFDSLKELLSLRDNVERPAADWARLQAHARRLDPFLRNHSELAFRIVDWPGLWRAWDEAVSGAPALWKAPTEPLFRFEAAARVEDAANAARRAAEDEIAREAGAENEDGDSAEDDRRDERDSASYLPARMLVRMTGSRFWASRLIDLAAILAADPPPSDDSGCTLGCFAPSPAADSAFDVDVDMYFWDMD